MSIFRSFLIIGFLSFSASAEKIPSNDAKDLRILELTEQLMTLNEHYMELQLQLIQCQAPERQRTANERAVKIKTIRERNHLSPDDQIKEDGTIVRAKNDTPKKEKSK